MKVRWREREIIFAAMINAIMLGSYLWRIHNTTPEQYAGPFVKKLNKEDDHLLNET